MGVAACMGVMAVLLDAAWATCVSSVGASTFWKKDPAGGLRRNPQPWVLDGSRGALGAERSRNGERPGRDRDGDSGRSVGLGLRG